MNLAGYSDAELIDAMRTPTPERVFQVAEALRRGVPPAEVAAASRIDRWFIDQIAATVAVRLEIEAGAPSGAAAGRAKRWGYSDAQLAHLWGITPGEVRDLRTAVGTHVTYKTVDTCAAEFEASTPYFYSTYEEESEAPPAGDRTVVVLGSGPNRIGQGIEFDYCCVHAAFALEDAGYEPVMVNCNPETVSTDYDTSARLYFEPLTVEDVLAVIDVEQPRAVIVQLGGQTPLSLAGALAERGVPIAGTAPDAIDVAEDRRRFAELCLAHGIPQPDHGIARTREDAHEIAVSIGFPVLVRPSYVLGGRAMRIVYSNDDLAVYLDEWYHGVSGSEVDLAGAPLLIDRFLESAVEVDVDAVFDGHDLYIGGIMEHVEEAGVHSGDSACIVPPPSLDDATIQRIEDLTRRLASALEVSGLINIQFAVRGEEVFVLEANPRASRTVPFVSKATGVPLAKVATRIMMGERIRDLRAEGTVPPSTPRPSYTAVKEAVLPWRRFPDEDTVLGPEMRATGEVMGIGSDPGDAFGRAWRAAGHDLPVSGTAFVSLADADKVTGERIAGTLTAAGFTILATRGTAHHLAAAGIAVHPVDKVGEGPYDPVRLIEEGTIDLVVNTPAGGKARGDGRLIRMAAARHGVACTTTAAGGLAAAHAIAGGAERYPTVTSLQDHHRTIGST